MTRGVFQPTFYGWCGTSFEEQGRAERLEQRLEIDPDEMYERIEVPKFGANRPAIFVHDFRQVGSGWPFGCRQSSVIYEIRDDFFLGGLFRPPPPLCRMCPGALSKHQRGADRRDAVRAPAIGYCGR